MFHIVFVAPEIPPNTGNAIRLAACTGAHLHLVEPLGFTLDEAPLRRAGLDYHDLAKVTVHTDLDGALADIGAARVYAFTASASTRFTDIAYQPGDVLMFGRESIGLGAEVLARPDITAQVYIPMVPGRRSLNLANSAALATYEAWRQHDFVS
jgi:tRNA (cytidine/uridine-2'-O-)-methyltransferase